ncbi:MAG: carbohydrate kinase [Treponema sp.]|jgi:fructokinase|nr:carbohydrate kinase [Treponema sp.]
MIVCCGEALIDMLPLNGGTGFLPCPGGSPYNTAIAISRLGTPVGFLGRLSTDFFGELLVNRLIENKVETGLIVRSGENSTLAFVQLEPGKEPRYVFYTEGTADRSLRLADLPITLPEKTSSILFGSIAMTMEPVASAIESLVFREHARGTSGPVISVDPNIRPFMIGNREAYLKRFEGWVAVADIVKISEADFAFIYPGATTETAMEQLLCLGPRVVVTTLGAAGAMALFRQDDGGIIRVYVPVVDLPVVDTIGAGDTFHGALLSWLEREGKLSRTALASLTEEELVEALFFANKAASLVCSKQGANPPTRAEVEALKFGNHGG